MINDFVKVDKSRFNDAIKAYFLFISKVNLFLIIKKIYL